MNLQSIALLVRKDLYLRRRALGVYAAASVVGLAVLALADPSWRWLGTTLLLNVLIGMTFHLPIVTILGERENRTLSFVLSLPVAPMDFAIAKYAASIAMFLVPCAVIAVGVGPKAWQQSGVVVLLALLAIFVVVIGVTIVSESMSWTFAAIGAAMVGANAVMHSALPAALREASGAALIAVELGVMGVAILATLLAQGRKTSFV